MNALAPAIFFGKQGELRERTMQHQLQRASALNIIINAISVWNTIYLTEALERTPKELRSFQRRTITSYFATRLGAY
jgi:TnpA family transposase